MQSISSILRSLFSRRSSTSGITATKKRGFFSRIFGRGFAAASRQGVKIEVPTPISSTTQIDEYIAEIDHKIEIGIVNREEVSARNYASLQKHLVYRGKISAEIAEEKFQKYTILEDSDRGNMWLEDKTDYAQEFSEWDLH